MTGPDDIRGVSVFDLDGTLTHRDTFRAFLLYCLIRRPSRWLVVPRLTVYASLFAMGKRDNEWLKAQFLGAILGGMATPLVTNLVDGFIANLRTQGFRQDGLHEMQERRLAGDTLVLASASPNLYVDVIGAELGFDHVIATRVGWTDERLLAGHLLGGNCRGAEKRDRVEALLNSMGIDGPIRAYSDHHADLPLLTWADHAIAVSPTSKLREAAREIDAEIVNWD